MLWGRDEELEQLEQLLDKRTSSLVVITGRRRIGKSTLVHFFSKKHFKNSLEFSGLAPHDKQTNQDQLNHFARQLSEQTSVPGFHFTDWTDAFTALNSFIQSRKTPMVVFFDEFSWMAHHDLDFPGKLKVAWDTKFKSHPKLMMILCGSVTSWIQANILRRADFVGRISLEMNLGELPLKVLHQFWGPHSSRISPFEKLRILLITGGVPRYLEEIRPKTPAHQEIARLCFQKTGFLFNEYDKIFNEIFQKKAVLYRKLIEALVHEHLSAVQIAKKLNRSQNSELTDALAALELSGFIAREFVFLPSGKKTKISRYRLKDNYLRFYLKYIEPMKEKIKQNYSSLKTVDHLSNWSIIAGFQFENLILNHLPEIIEKIRIEPSSILSAAPYLQRKKTRNKGGCQIDLLIVCKHKTLYLCEIKLRNSISNAVIKDVKDKMAKMENARSYSIRPILICAGEIEKNSQNELNDFFDRIISIEELIA